MPDLNFNARCVASSFTVTMLVVALSGCVSPEQQRQADLYADQGTCAQMGARYGSPAHTNCMLQQQQRRDEEHTRFMQEAYLASEMARNAQEMRDQQDR
ncbi:MAG: hypothetical protein IBJ07_11785 [Rhizobiaceae bacterium]|nr:hypothetical protein [Rhizobiaceae bacterium]